jgi:hypothetical protein
MLPAHGDHALFDACLFAVKLMRHPAFKFLQPSIAVRIEARFPVIERGSPYVGLGTGFGDVTGFFPNLEEKPALLWSCEAKVRSFLAHVVILPDFPVLFKVQLTKTDNCTFYSKGESKFEHEH